MESFIKIPTKPDSQQQSPQNFNNPVLNYENGIAPEIGKHLPDQTWREMVGERNSSARRQVHGQVAWVYVLSPVECRK